jgi:hypothetical protein
MDYVMTPSSLNSSTLCGLIKLTERKESLVLEIAKIDAQLSSLILGKTAPVEKRRGRPMKKATIAPKKLGDSPTKRTPRGALKKKILTSLRVAGNAGLKVPELSKKIGVKNQNIHVWFSSTGKNLPEIKRVGKGHFKLQEE